MHWPTNLFAQLEWNVGWLSASQYLFVVQIEHASVALNELVLHASWSVIDLAYKEQKCCWILSHEWSSQFPLLTNSVVDSPLPLLSRQCDCRVKRSPCHWGLYSRVMVTLVLRCGHVVMRSQPNVGGHQRRLDTVMWHTCVSEFMRSLYGGFWTEKTIRIFSVLFSITPKELVSFESASIRISSQPRSTPRSFWL